MGIVLCCSRNPFASSIMNVRHFNMLSTHISGNIIQCLRWRNFRLFLTFFLRITYGCRILLKMYILTSKWSGINWMAELVFDQSTLLIVLYRPCQKTCLVVFFSHAEIPAWVTILYESQYRALSPACENWPEFISEQDWLGISF